MPRRMSVCPVASQILTPLAIGITTMHASSQLSDLPMPSHHAHARAVQQIHAWQTCRLIHHNRRANVAAKSRRTSRGHFFGNHQISNVASRQCGIASVEAHSYLRPVRTVSWECSINPYEKPMAGSCLVRDDNYLIA